MDIQTDDYYTYWWTSKLMTTHLLMDVQTDDSTLTDGRPNWRLYTYWWTSKLTTLHLLMDDQTGDYTLTDGRPNWRLQTYWWTSELTTTHLLMDVQTDDSTLTDGRPNWRHLLTDVQTDNTYWCQRTEPTGLPRCCGRRRGRSGCPRSGCSTPPAANTTHNRNQRPELTTGRGLEREGDYNGKGTRTGRGLEREGD